jgi:elongation factor P--(R)-beta-lysine ligase
VNDFASQAPVANLVKRASLLKRLRAFFDDRGFVEVQTPVLSQEIIIDRHLDPIVAPVLIPGHPMRDWYLQTSPEQSMKRLLASGMGNIYQVGPVFRSGERGRLHNPEFTMAEWYDVGANFQQGMDLLSRLISELLEVPPCKPLAYAEAFRMATNLDVLQSSNDSLASWAVSESLVESVDWSNDWNDWVDLIFSERVQPKLGWDGPILLTHFPASQAALAQVCSRDFRVAERYEAFCQGVELANGYHELLDADELERRTVIANQQRVRDGKNPLPSQNRLLDAMRSGMPNSCGCALGFDRVVMLACGAKSVAEVMSFVSENA